VVRDRHRQTFSIPTSISRASIDKVKANAERLGYKSLRAYIEALIDCEDAPPPPLAASYPSSTWAIGPTVLGHRTLHALDALTDRIRSGEDCEALRADLMSLRWEIGQMLLALRVDYDSEVEARDAKHYGRFGMVD
jgi:hypothetical protein